MRYSLAVETIAVTQILADLENMTRGCNLIRAAPKTIIISWSILKDQMRAHIAFLYTFHQVMDLITAFDLNQSSDNV